MLNDPNPLGLSEFIDEVVMTSDSPSGLGSFSMTDLRYSVYGVVDSNGVLLERYKYDPYGKHTVMNAGYGVLAESAIGQEFGYTGRRHDSEDTGLMYFRARYYSEELGRFVSRDPLGTALDVNMQYALGQLRAALGYMSQGMNLYASIFVVNGMDPSGMHCDDCAAPYQAALEAAEKNLSSCEKAAAAFLNSALREIASLRAFAQRGINSAHSSCVSMAPRNYGETARKAWIASCDVAKGLAEDFADLEEVIATGLAEATYIVDLKICGLVYDAAVKIADSNFAKCNAAFNEKDCFCPVA